MVCCFVEMDNGTMNRKMIRAKYARYLTWSQSAVGKQYLIDLYRRHGATGVPSPSVGIAACCSGVCREWCAPVGSRYVSRVVARPASVVR